MAAASRPPLYHDVLQLPKNEHELEKLLRLDVRENIRLERVARAGFNGSGVSRNNRLIERHESGGLVYWRSYDFAGNTGRQNLFAHPLGPDDADGTFRPDGGEIIFSLPNGLQGYLLVDAAGRRIDKGPTAIVSDPRRPDRAVENGLSCMSCHAKGMIDKADQVRDHVLKNADAFAPADLETVKALYPPRQAFAELLQKDAKRFQDAVARTGAPLTATEPIAALALRFEAELDLALAAAEAGVRPEQVLKALELSPALARQVGALKVEGGTVQRQVFVDAFPELVQALRLGEFLEPRNKSLANWIKLGGELARQGHHPAAVKAFAEALALDPENVTALLGRGNAFRAQGDLERAVADYTEALRLDPRSALAYHQRGAAHHDRRELDQAIADYTEALRLDPKDAVAWHNRGFAYFDQGDYDRAIGDYTEAIRLDPRYAVAFNNRGLARQRKGQLDQAVADFGEAIRLDPGYVMARVNRGGVHHNRGDYARAVAEYTEAIRLDPKSAVALNNRGLSYHEQRDYDRAIADFTEAIKLRPQFAVAHFNRGLSRNQKQQFDEAIADFTRAIELTPDFARAYYYRGLAHERKGDAARAAADREKAIKLDPSLGRE